MNNALQTDVILLDLTKAFNKVPHDALCSKLYNCGIGGSTFGWIQHFLKHRTQQVLVDGCTSTPSIVAYGVPQGTVLAPLLFFYVTSTISLKIYADDILIYRPLITCKDCEIL